MNRQDSRTPNRSELSWAEGVLQETIFPGSYDTKKIPVSSGWRHGVLAIQFFCCRSLEDGVGLAREIAKAAVGEPELQRHHGVGLELVVVAGAGHGPALGQQHLALAHLAEIADHG